MRARRYLLTGVAAVYFGALVGLTFVPAAASNRDGWMGPFIAFVPVGLLLVMLLGRRRWWAALAFAILGSAWIEAAQSIWMPAGYADLRDVVWASFGAIAGVALAVILTSPRMRSMRVHESPRIVAQATPREIPQD